jgi:hypothetical protein
MKDLSFYLHHPWDNSSVLTFLIITVLVVIDRCTLSTPVNQEAWHKGQQCVIGELDIVLLSMALPASCCRKLRKWSEQASQC